MFDLEPHISAKAYLALECSSKERHEYVEGTLHSMAGGSGRHNRISLNITAHFLAAAPSSCRIYQEGMKLRAAETLSYYPDVMAVCTPEPADTYFETEPCVLVEVLSPST